MHPVSTLMPSLLSWLTIVAPVGVGEVPTAGAINVQVVGRLVTVGQKGEDESEWTVTGYVHAEGRDLLLDCSANATAQKLLKAEHGNPDPLTSSARPVRNVQVKGRLKFRPKMKTDDKGKRVEQTDTIPVILVESLKLVE